MKAFRWILGLVTIFVGVFVLDLVFYNYVFNSELMAQGGLVRSPEELRKLMPVMFGGQFLFALLFTYYFFKIYKEAKLLPLRGFLYGFWVGLFIFGLKAVWEFYLFAISTKLILFMLGLGWIECIIAGITLGVIGWVLPMILGGMAGKQAAAVPAPPAPPSAPAQ